MRGASSWPLPFVLLSLKQPHRAFATIRVFARSVWAAIVPAQMQEVLQAAGAKNTAAVTIAAPTWTLYGGLWYGSLVSCSTHSVTFDAGNMATNLTQIDKDLKALAAKVDGFAAGLAIVANDVTAIRVTLDELVGGPSDDESQAKIDELTAKLKDQEEKLHNALNPIMTQES